MRRITGQPAAPDDLGLAAVASAVEGRTIELAIEKFEETRKKAGVDLKLWIRESTERADGVLVCYQVEWIYSVFEDTRNTYAATALVRRAGAAGEATFRVIAAALVRRFHLISIPAARAKATKSSAVFWSCTIRH